MGWPIVSRGPCEPGKGWLLGPGALLPIGPVLQSGCLPAPTREWSEVRHMHCTQVGWANWWRPVPQVQAAHAGRCRDQQGSEGMHSGVQYTSSAQQLSGEGHAVRGISGHPD